MENHKTKNFQAGIDYNPNAEIEWFAQVAGYTECLYDYRQSAEFIFNVDIDDFLIPKHFGASIPQELLFLADRFPQAASFEFLWQTTIVRSGECQVLLKKNPHLFSFIA
jgi:hypothetical protein